MLLSAPDDYGLSPARTLAHVAAAPPLPGFGEHWAAWREEIEALPASWRGTVVDPENEVVITSVRDVRVVARVALPEGPPRGVVITVHGSAPGDVMPPLPEPWTERGVATVRLRLRGFPPSTMDTGELRGPTWILSGIESADAWIPRGAVADIVQAWRNARRCFGDLPIALHGESLGGGLAVIAAAQIDALESARCRGIDRMVVSLPSLGDWSWRAGRYCNGAGALVNRELVRLRTDAAALVRTLLLHDAATHAAHVACPTLVKLALRDDVVPAPAAAAVFNALGGPRWRYVVAYGHFDGGIADARRHAWFERLHPLFVDPASDPDGAVAEIRARREVAAAR